MFLTCIIYCHGQKEQNKNLMNYYLTRLEPTTFCTESKHSTPKHIPKLLRLYQTFVIQENQKR